MLTIILSIAAIIAIWVSVAKSIRYLKAENTKMAKKFAWIAVGIFLVFSVVIWLVNKFFVSTIDGLKLGNVGLKDNQIRLDDGSIESLYVDNEAIKKVVEMSRAKQFEFVALRTFTKEGITFNEGQKYTGGYFYENSELPPRLSNDFLVDNDKATSYFKQILLITNYNPNTPNPEVKITNIPSFRV